MITPGIYDSWEIIDNVTAFKHCGKSVFDHHGSGIPIDTRSFFNVDDLSIGSRKNITLYYNGLPYNAYISKDRHSRTRIFWYADLIQQFNKVDYQLPYYPILKFERYKQDQYIISFSNTSYENVSEMLSDSLITREVLSFKEGSTSIYYTTKYERDPRNRAEAIQIHGTKCQVCGFDFEATYGTLGYKFIEVHHVKPLHTLTEAVSINPETDLVCVCSNCHRMMHHIQGHVLSVDELKKRMARKA